MPFIASLFNLSLLVSQQIQVKAMGECYSKQANQQPFRTTTALHPIKCIILENPHSLVLEISDGSVETIPITKHPQQLAARMGPGLFFGSNNQVILIMKSKGLKDKAFMQAIHAYHEVRQQASGFIEPNSLSITKYQGQLYLIIQSRPLGDKSVKFVDLVDLGRKMKEKEICWQDLEFGSIVNQVIHKCGQIRLKQFSISNIIVGNDGSVHILSLFDKTHSAKTSQQLQQILLQSLFGKKIRKTQISALQQISKFKHKGSLSQIEGIQYLLEQNSKNKNKNTNKNTNTNTNTNANANTNQNQNKSQPSFIVNPSLKFIRDYISAYHYQLEIFHFDFLQALCVLGQYQSALKLLELYMLSKGFNDIITEQTYKLYQKQEQLQRSISPKSSQTILIKKKVCSAARHLAEQFKAKNQYNQALKYFNECRQYQQQNFDKIFYLDLAEVCRALNKNIEAEGLLIEGIDQHPSSRILYLQLIIYICDCMRIEQAEQQLFKATQYFRTIEMSIASAKIMITKSILHAQKRAQFLKTAQQELKKVILDQYPKQQDHNNIVIALYHEIFGDCFFQEHKFDSAREEYHVCKILLKNFKVSGYRLANITAAQANCLMMEGNFEQAIKIYNEAQSYTSPQCKTLIDSIIGNKGIAKIKKGAIEEGKKQIQEILETTSSIIVENDYNYTFFKNVLAALEVQRTTK